MVTEQIILLICVMAGFVVKVLVKHFRPRFRGVVGEQKTAFLLGMLPKSKYKVIDDIMLQAGGRTTQIDHIVVSKSGLFVIETKNYKGWIFGHENGEKWIQNIYGRKYEFQNPIRQNHIHIRALKQVLSDFREMPIIPIVAFSSRATLKIHTENHNVVLLDDLNSTIKKYNDDAISPDIMEKIIDRLEECNVNSPEKRKLHIKSIKRRRKYEETAIASGICPRCGGSLTRRRGEYGYFYGCSNFPRCRYTHK